MRSEKDHIYKILTEFAARHAALDGSFAGPKYEDMDRVVKEIDWVRGLGKEQSGEEPGQTPGELKGVQRLVFESMAQSAPLLLLIPRIRRIGGHLRKSAEADIIQSIVKCETFLEQFPVDGDSGDLDVQRLDRICLYLDRLRDLQAKLEKPGKGSIRKIIKELAEFPAHAFFGSYAPEEPGAIKLYLTKSYFQKLSEAVEKAGGDLTEWRDRISEDDPETEREEGPG